MEKWEIALGGGFKAFKTALLDSTEAWRKAVTDTLKVLASHVSFIPGQTVPPDVVADLSRREMEIMEKATYIHAAIWDLRVATQNRLLGDLFTYRIPARRPTDPRYHVTTVSEHEKDA